jgi:succinyl-CoA synthetase beta subunit
MNLHEYQAKRILQKYGIAVPDFVLISMLEEIDPVLSKWPLEEAVVKIQVHAGGRGKAGGIKIAKNRADIRISTQQLLGMKVVNNQTGPEGIIAKQVILTPLIHYQREYYVGATINREKSQACLIVSPEGGVEIEEVAAKHPDKILSVPIELTGRVRDYHLVRLLKFMGWTGALAKQGKELFTRLAQLFMDCDASLLEINPLVQTEQGELIALDAKLSLDDNALYRQTELASQFDFSQLSEKEVQAKQQDLAYVALEGDIGCMVNGAGLAMATMDMIQLEGGKPANFLDVGGGASEDKVAEGFKIILSDAKVKAILVNIFGGIMNCDTLAAGIVSAAQQLKLQVPLVIRMEGTEVEKGRHRLLQSGLALVTASSLGEAAKLAVQAAKTGNRG